jgi:hypothetical protein
MTKGINERPNHFLKRKYCTHKCYQKVTKYDRNVKDFSGTTVNKIKVLKKDSPGRYVRQCYCGKEFITRHNRLLHGTTRSCGCYRKKLFVKNRKPKRGKDHPNWNPLLTDKERDRWRRFPEQYGWRKEVFKNSNYKCVICNKGGYLQAHHLDGWHWCKERRFDPTNGVALCRQCHKGFHKVYQNNSNTAEEFFEFLLVKRASIRGQENEKE